MQCYHNLDSCVIFPVTKKNFQRLLLHAFHRICLYVGNYSTSGILKNTVIFFFHANMSNCFEKKSKKGEAMRNSGIRIWFLILSIANIAEV